MILPCAISLPLCSISPTFSAFIGTAPDESSCTSARFENDSSVNARTTTSGGVFGAFIRCKKA